MEIAMMEINVLTESKISLDPLIEFNHDFKIELLASKLR
jgi:hypothetical protein